jgi:8-oxo-dGTP diphosphatase
MKIPRLRFNSSETSNNQNWQEVGDIIAQLYMQGKKLNPKNINDALDEIDGVITFSGESAKIYNEDGDIIVRDRGTRLESLSAIIRKIGRLTGHSVLENYFISKKPKPQMQSGFQKPLNFGMGSQQSFYQPKKPFYSKSYGGVVIRKDGMILVVEPANHYSGVIWTFPKGGIDEGETPEQAGLREVKEESGWDAEIIAKIDGSWKGTTTITEYFLMKPIGVQGDWQYQGTPKEETWRTVFVPYECARLLVSSSHKQSAQRDVEVLDKAYAMWLNLNRKGKI